MTSLDVTDYNIEHEDTIEDWFIGKQLAAIVNCAICILKAYEYNPQIFSQSSSIFISTQYYSYAQCMSLSDH